MLFYFSFFYLFLWFEFLFLVDDIKASAKLRPLRSKEQAQLNITYDDHCSWKYEDLLIHGNIFILSYVICVLVSWHCCFYVKCKLISVDFTIISYWLFILEGLLCDFVRIICIVHSCFIFILLKCTLKLKQNKTFCERHKCSSLMLFQRHVKLSHDLR